MTDYRECRAIIGWETDPDVDPPHNRRPVTCLEYTERLERSVVRLAEECGVNSHAAQTALAELRRNHAGDHVSDPPTPTGEAVSRSSRWNGDWLPTIG